MNSSPVSPTLEYWALSGGVLIWLVWSGIDAHSPRMWGLEALPVLLGLMVVFLLRHRFPLSPVLLRLLTFFAFLHLIGAHYSFSHVPVGDWLRDLFLLQRNHFDRIAHFFQGCTSAIVFREIFIRVLQLRDGKAVFLLASSCSLAFSAFYELLEFGAWTLILLRYTQKNILGAQGDIWDTQWDMLMALIGAFTALVALKTVHGVSMERIMKQSTAKKNTLG